MNEDLQLRIGGDPAGALAAFKQVTGGAQEMAGAFVAETAKMIASFVGVEKAIEGVKESVGKSDEIRDLGNALTILTGSYQNAAGAMKFFDEAQKTTRNTAEQLATTYRDLLPQAISRGFSQESLQTITQWLSQVAPLMGKSLEEMENGFKMLLAGRVQAGRNPLLAALGITKEQVAGLQWDDIYKLLQEKAARASELMGQTFASTFGKTKDEILKDIGEGINEAFGSGVRGGGIAGALTTPEMVAAWHTAGKVIGDILRGDIMSALGQITNASPEDFWSKARRELNPANWFKPTGGGLLGVLAGDARGNALSAIPNAPIADPMLVGQWAAREVGIQPGMTPGGFGGMYKDFLSQFGSDIISNPDKTKQILASLRDEVKSGAISWTDYQSSVQYAIKGLDETTKKADLAGAAHGNVAAKLKKEADAWEELARVMGQKSFVDEMNSNAFFASQMMGSLPGGTPRGYTGNIDLNNRPIVRNSDGSVSTVRSISISIDGQEILIPTVDLSGLGVLTNEQAISQFMKTGQNLGRYNSIAEADWAAMLIHDYQENAYSRLVNGDLPTRNLGFSASDMAPTSDLDNLSNQLILKAIDNAHARDVGKAMGEAAAKQMQLDAAGNLGDAFGALFKRGASGFTQQLSKEFDGLMAQGARTFQQTLFGRQADKNPDGTYGPDKQANPYLTGGLIDAQKNPNAARYGDETLAFASIGFGAYQSGKQAPSNAVGMGALQGAIGGANYGWVGAVVGAIIGAVGGYEGAKKTRSEYLYGTPEIDASGNVTITNTRNIQDAQRQQMVGQVQDTVDSFRNQYIRLLMKLGVTDANPFSAIDGKFQDNPSSHFMEHFQQWLSQTLPREIAKQFQGELRSGFGNLGLSGSQFDSMWTKYNGLDPAKAAQMMNGLADALKMFQDSSKFFGQSASGRLSDITAKGNLSFADSLDEGDSKILEFGSHLKDLVGEDQIRASQELGNMMTQRMDAEKQFMQEIVNVLKAGKSAADALNQNLDIRLIHKADGSADPAALAKYYQGDADSALKALTGAKNPQDAQAAWNRFLSDLDKVSQLGYSISTKTGDDYTKWAQQQIANMQPIFDQVLRKMGDDVAGRDKAFLAAIAPSIEAFKNSLGGTNVSIGRFGDNAAVASTNLITLGNQAAIVATVFERIAKAADSASFRNATQNGRLVA